MLCNYGCSHQQHGQCLHQTTRPQYCQATGFNRQLFTQPSFLNIGQIDPNLTNGNFSISTTGNVNNDTLNLVGTGIYDISVTIGGDAASQNPTSSSIVFTIFGPDTISTPLLGRRIPLDIVTGQIGDFLFSINFLAQVTSGLGQLGIQIFDIGGSLADVLILNTLIVAKLISPSPC